MMYEMTFDANRNKTGFTTSFLCRSIFVDSIIEKIRKICFFDDLLVSLVRSLIDVDSFASLSTMKIIIASLVVFALFSVCESESDGENFGRKYCNKPACLDTASRMLYWMDQTIDICSNLYNYTCKGLSMVRWRKQSILRATLHNRIIIWQEPFVEQYVEQSFAGYAEYMTRNKISNFLLEPIEEEDEVTIKVSKLFYNRCIDKSEKEFEKLWNSIRNLKKLPSFFLILVSKPAYIEETSPHALLEILQSDYAWGVPFLERKSWNINGNFDKFDILTQNSYFWELFMGGRPELFVFEKKNGDYHIIVSWRGVKLETSETSNFFCVYHSDS